MARRANAAASQHAESITAFSGQIVTSGQGLARRVG